MSQKIGVVGSRRRNQQIDYDLVRAKVLKYYHEGDIIISGGCGTGADSFAERLARELGATIVIHHANWDKHGKGAGLIRNTKTAEDSDILLACVSIDRTGGTEDTIEKFKKLGKTGWLTI